MDDRQRAALRCQQVALVKDLEPRGGVLDALLEDGVLTENDCERITHAPTRRDRCQMLLHMIPTRGPTAYGSFRRALQRNSYGFLADGLQLDGMESLRGDSEASARLQGGQPGEYDNTGREGETVAKHQNSIVQRPKSRTQCSQCAGYIQKTLSLGVNENANADMVTMLEQHGCQVLDNVEPVDVIDSLFQDEIISTDDVDLVRSGLTRRQRCELLIQAVLVGRSDRAVVSLAEALSKKYKYIADKIRGNEEDLSVVVGDTETTVRKVLEAEDVDTDVHSTEANSVTEIGEQIGVTDENEDTVLKMKMVTDNDHGLDVADGGHVKCNDLLMLAERNADKVSCTAKATGNQRSKQKPRSQRRAPNTSLQTRDDAGLPTSMAVVPSEASHKSRRLTVAFNYLSTLINQGEFDKYEQLSSRLSQRNPANYDLLCILGYLNASRDLFRTDFDSAKTHIQSTMALVPRTSNPRYFLLELFTAKTRMYITQKKLEKLQTTLDEAMQVLETDPEGCTGRAAGWLYINNARNVTAQLSCLNLSKPSARQLYEHLFARAKTSFQRSMNNFTMDGGKDGPFGFGYALCRLVILLLRCGDNGLTMSSMVPPKDDVHAAGQYLQFLEDSDTPIPKILDMHLSLAKCDYQFRRGHLVRSLEHAQTAHGIAVDLNMLEFTEHAHNRVRFLRSKAPPGGGCHDISEAEVHEILFGQSDSDGTAFSE